LDSEGDNNALSEEEDLKDAEIYQKSKNLKSLLCNIK
jgi:hypothetical protein